MKKINLTFGIFFFSISTMIGQSEWEIFAVMDKVQEAEFYNDKAFITNRGGLLVIDITTGEEELWNSSNSSLIGTGTKEIEIHSDGTMWLTNYKGNGILYYDGSEFKQHYYLDSGEVIVRPDHLISHNDEIWFRARGFSTYGEIYSYQNGEFIKEVNLPGFINNLSMDPEGNLWVVNSDSIAKLESSILLKQYGIPGFNISTDNIQHLHIDNQNRHWISISQIDQPNDIIWLYDQETWYSWDVKYAPNNFIESADGKISFNTNKAVGHIENGEISVDSLHHVYLNIPSRLESQYILNYEDSENLWLYSFDGYENNSLYRINSTDTVGFGSNEGNYLHPLPEIIEVDCDGNLYSLDDGGILKYTNTWNPFEYEPRDSTCLINYLELNPHTCELWGYSSTTNCLSFFRINDTEIIEADVLSSLNISSMTFDEKGSVYTSINGNIIEIDTVGVTHEISLPDDIRFISEIHYASDNSLWALGSNSDFRTIILRLQDDNWTITNEDDFPLEQLDTRFFFEDLENNIWIKFADGLAKYDGSIWESFPIELPEDYASITGMVMDNSGSYWMSTTGSGLVKWDGQNQPTFYNEINSNIYDDICYSIKLAKDNIIYLGHLYGISKMTIDNLPSNTKETKKPNTNSSHFSLYPNPTHSDFTLSFPHAEKRKIEIFNLNGQQVYSVETSELDLELDLELSEGCYWVKASGASGIAVEKLMVY